jgi:hypothetical protein
LYQKGENVMKFATPFLAALAMIGMALAARLVTEGVLPALVSTAIEQGSKFRRARRRR